MGILIDIGSFIKLQRTKKDMTQGELAKGIVSLSYLSKIENKKTEASPEIIQMLCTRLGVQLNNDLDMTIQEKCKEWYSILFESTDKEKIIATYQEIQELMNSNLSENLLMFEIHKIRYHLVLGEQDAALDKINELNEMADSFDHLQQYYWYKFRGNYNSTIGEFNQAIKLYKLAEEKVNKVDIEEAEIADLHYIMAVTHSKLRNTLEVIDFAEKALEIYMKEYNFRRCAQSHIVLGISYRRIKMYEKAIKNYNLARHLGELNKDKSVIQLTNLNLGYLHSAIGNSREAIQYFMEVSEDEEVSRYQRLAAITSLIKEYYEDSNSHEEMEETITKAFEIAETVKDEMSYKLFYYMIHTYNYATKGEYEKFRSLVIEEFIPYLKEQKDYANLVVYSNMLAAHFESIGKYKDSVKYYKLANSTYEELINL
ncbi:helix-turn-helix domain-containing protein [Virgibacillus sediminis]|uniref:Helix-turn-helix domain-containing protein n=1 Tax=Virgibacillus sediminis TaxID=202260 RepID=A0ABV7A9E0_9BACI